MQFIRLTQCAPHLSPEITSGGWFAWIKAFLHEAGLQVGSFFGLSQGHVMSAQLELAHGEVTAPP